MNQLPPEAQVKFCKHLEKLRDEKPPENLSNDELRMVYGIHGTALQLGDTGPWEDEVRETK